MQPGDTNAASSDAAEQQHDVEVLLQATRVLVGVATRGLEQAGSAVSVAQLRLLTTLYQAGSLPSARAAAELGSVASSVTRLADQLERSGHVLRRGRPGNRSVVLLELTDTGRQLVDAILDSRRAELAAILDRLPQAERQRLVQALQDLCRIAGPAGSAAALGPLPL